MRDDQRHRYARQLDQALQGETDERKPPAKVTRGFLQRINRAMGGNRKKGGGEK